MAVHGYLRVDFSRTGVTCMSDWISDYDEYRGFKDVADVLEDARKLRFLYGERRFDEMDWHIRLLMVKYPVETVSWNSVNTCAPRNEDEKYRAAEEFLRGVAAEKVGKGLMAKEFGNTYGDYCHS